MKVLLANPPWRKDGKLCVRAGSRWPHSTQCPEKQKIPDYVPFPFFLAYSAAVLDTNRIDVCIIDSIAEGHDPDEFLRIVQKIEPDLVLIETSTPSIENDLIFARGIKLLLDGVYVVLAGPHVSALPEEALANFFVDCVLIGEYEYTLLELVKTLECGNGPENVQGLAYRTSTKKTNVAISKSRRGVLLDVDGLPWPSRELLPIYNYNDTFAGMKKPNVSIMASRGCPFGCTYCLWPKVMYGGKKYRTRNPIDVVEEMKYLVDRYGFKSVYFDDDTFNIGKGRMLEICSLIKEKGIDVPWGIMARADTSDYETLRAMKDAGLYAVKYGVESGCQELVDGANKKLDLNNVRKTVWMTKGLGIKVHLTFTFGLPNETWSSVRQTIDFAKELDPDSVQFSIITPYPGTEYFDYLDKRGFLFTKVYWPWYDGSTKAIVRTEEMFQDDLEDALRMARKEWSRYSLKRELKRNPVGCVLKGIRHPASIIRAFGGFK